MNIPCCDLGSNFFRYHSCYVWTFNPNIWSLDKSGLVPTIILLEQLCIPPLPTFHQVESQTKKLLSYLRVHV